MMLDLHGESPSHPVLCASCVERRIALLQQSSENVNANKAKKINFSFKKNV
jgi:uncharacterized small protein (DUF1192 family)